MKPVILEVLVLLLISQNEALRCYCGGNRQCSSHIETCYGYHDVCVSVEIIGPEYRYFKGCYVASDCARLNKPGSIIARCCDMDFCN